MEDNDDEHDWSIGVDKNKEDEIEESSESESDNSMDGDIERDLVDKSEDEVYADF